MSVFTAQSRSLTHLRLLFLQAAGGKEAAENAPKKADANTVLQLLREVRRGPSRNQWLPLL